MNQEQPLRTRTAEILFAVALAVLFTLALHQSWGMWFEPVADTGRDLYIPEQIAEGDLKLYRDVSYLYPPLAPYLLAAVVSIFGSDLGVMTWVGITTSGLIVLLLYLVGRRWSGPAAGFLLAFLFITVHMTGISGYSFNFIFPYAHNATFGFFFLLLFLYALMRYAVDQGPAHWLSLALVAGTIAGWSKIEYAATFLIILVASFIVRKPRITTLVIAAAGNLGLLAGFTWYFSDAPPERHWLTMNILPQTLLSGSVARRFYDRIQGLDQPAMNLKIALAGTLLIVGSVICLVALERALRSGDGRRRIIVPLIVLAFAALQFGLARHFLFFRGWFLIQWLLIPFAILDRKRTPLLLPLLFSILLGSRILLRLEPTWYGFLFAIPAEIVILYVLFHELPRRNAYSRRVALAWAPLILLIGVGSLASQREVFDSREPNLVTTPRGTYYDRLPDRSVILNELFEFLERREPESMAVVPEGLAINWLAGVESSIPYHTFSPAELPDTESQQIVIDALRASPPEIILLIRRDYGEFGFVGIGKDYGHELIRQIECLYEPAVYRESEVFFAVVMERTSDDRCR